MELTSFAKNLIFATSIQEKMFLPDQFVDTAPHSPARLPSFPARPPSLDPDFVKSRSGFPSLKNLAEPRVRGLILHFFANHELLAMELMALALLKFPAAPPAFRMGLAHTIAEEIEHLSLYQKRMQQLGVAFGEVGVSRFFWDALQGMADPIDFVVGMSLTFEQANLDYCLYYEGKLRELGDDTTADILAKVYRDEISHVAHGVRWFDEWREAGKSQWSAYQASLKRQRPLTAIRAKGIGFDRKGRLEANLSLDYIAELEKFRGPKGRHPQLHWYNADAELEWSQGKRYGVSKGIAMLLADYEPLLFLLAEDGDSILCSRPPSRSFQKTLGQLTSQRLHFVQYDRDPEKLSALFQREDFRAVRPWAWTTSSRAMQRQLAARQSRLKQTPLPEPGFAQLFNKSRLVEWRRRIAAIEDLAIFGDLDTPLLDGVACRSLDEVLATIERFQADFGLPSIAKADWGFSGSGLKRLCRKRGISESDLGWVRRQLATTGSLLIEPCLEIELEFSFTWTKNKSGVDWNIFLTDRPSGRYLGALLGAAAAKIPSHLKEELLFSYGGSSLINRLMTYGSQLRCLIETSQPLLPHCGVDLFAYRRGGKLYIRCCSEINARTTMGHLAAALERKIKPAGITPWLLISLRQAQTWGFKTLQQLTEHLETVDQGEQAIIFTSDPDQAVGALSIALAPGKAQRWISHKLGIRL